jgi:hypothetical protein
MTDHRKQGAHSVLVDVLVLVFGVLVLGLCALRSRLAEPSPAGESAERRPRTFYLVGAVGGCLMIAGALLNLFNS